jgi:ATP-dependent exoDNAse (exonuclease V) beta subunit
MRKLGAEEDPKVQVLGAIDEWEGERLAKGSASAADLAACMRVFAEHGTNLGQAIRYAEHLFAQQGSLRLMTGHKSKGLEWDTVYILDEFLCRDDEQDLNLRYVMATRSKDRLYYINSRDIKW